MFDSIRGPVTDIIDGDTFMMKVTHTGKQNKFEYNNEEKVRIANIDEPELKTPAGQRSKYDLQCKLEGKEVRCRIQARDTFGRVVAEVEVL